MYTTYGNILYCVGTVSVIPHVYDDDDDDDDGGDNDLDDDE